MQARTRELYIPANAMKIEAKDCAAVFYLYDSPKGPAARAFIGKAIKPSWAFWFRTAAEREQRIAETIKQAKDSAARKAAILAERSQPSKLQIGDILYSSWGYDQTNIDFYQVTRLIGPTTVEIRQIASQSSPSEGHSSMAGYCTAIKDQFKGEPMVKRVQNGSRIKIENYASASPWDGKPKYHSWYA